MTPAARIAAAAEVLDAWLSGVPAERALTDWGRAHRFAGSGDRAAIRDLVFDALRCRRSFGWVGGADTGRGLMLGALRLSGQDPAVALAGPHGLPPLTADEADRPLAEAPEAVRLDAPDWLLPRLQAGLGAGAEAVLAAQRQRAPVWLRVNLARCTVAEAQAALAAEGIATDPHPQVKTALQVVENARKISASRTYAEGLVELQDAASQAVVEALGEVAGTEVLDYCAGGGGKALQLAAGGARVTAHDAEPRRMRDLPARAARAGAAIAVAAPGTLGRRRWPLVLVDAPCSGSGTWRRDPEAKWRLTPGRLAELQALQDRILAEALTHVAPGGRLAYVTCSVLPEEAEAAARLAATHPGLRPVLDRRLLPGPLGDGFSVAILALEGQDRSA